MNKIQLAKIWMSLVLAITCGCSLTDDSNDKVVQITPEFSIDMTEKLGPSSQLQFVVKTIENQNCLNYSLDLSAIKSKATAQLKINNIVVPENCQSGTAPARDTATLGQMLEGVYDFEVNLKNAIINLGKILVTDESYTIILNSTDGIELPHPQLRKIPEGTIWGFIGYDIPEAASVADSFLLEIASITEVPVLSNGYYGHFYLKNDQEISPLTTPDFSFWKMFLRLASDDLVEIKKILANYRNGSNGQNLEIQLYTWDGRVL